MLVRVEHGDNGGSGRAGLRAGDASGCAGRRQENDRSRMPAVASDDDLLSLWILTPLRKTLIHVSRWMSVPRVFEVLNGASRGAELR